MRLLITTLILTTFSIPVLAQQGNYVGQYSINRFAPNSTMNPSGSDTKFGNGPKLYTQDGEFRGNLNNNKFDPDSVANPYGKYGSKYSSESINNPYGAGSKYNQESPYNKFGQGLEIYDE